MNTAGSDKYTFNISLSVLNHLGRNLYRNFITVLGEAISNSWDADAKNVWIYIDREKGDLVIKDDGVGMTGSDFRGKFLKVGYSKRGSDSSIVKSPDGRPYIGRKGIGKLALLSCAKKVAILSRTSSSDYIGGTIDNSALDSAISEDDITYDLEGVNQDNFEKYKDDHSGTIILFDDIHDGIKKTEEYLRKVLALYFRFSLVDKSFHIYLNDKEISEKDLSSLAEKTQFLWNINTLEDPFISQELKNVKRDDVIVVEGSTVKGFVASVVKPSDLKVVNTEEKVGIDLFVNGRLREKNILRHMSAFSTRHVASYLYGQIHFDELDGLGEDNFTTSRESVKDGNEKFDRLIELLKDEVLEPISDTWDKWRLEESQEGDDENPRKTRKERKARALYDIASADYEQPEKDGEVKGWINELKPDAEYNIPAYVECFLSENLLRKKIENEGLTPSSCSNIDPSGKTCTDRHALSKSDGLCAYCKGNRGKQSLENQKEEALTSIKIRNDEENVLLYLDYIDLVRIIDDAILREEDKPYKPLRNSVMHTSRLTEEAKTKLTSIFDNIVATVRRLVGETRLES